jgi:uncharacterized membrane protein
MLSIHYKLLKGDLLWDESLMFFLVIGIILLVLWLMGLLTNYTFNGYVHIALIIGLICAGVWVLRRLIGSRR